MKKIADSVKSFYKKIGVVAVGAVALAPTFASAADWTATAPEFGWVVTAMGVIFTGMLLALVAKMGFRFLKSMFS